MNNLEKRTNYSPQYKRIYNPENMQVKEKPVRTIPGTHMPPGVLGYFDTIAEETTLPDPEYNTPEFFMFPDERKFVSHHEYGHANLGIRNETNTDYYASSRTGVFLRSLPRSNPRYKKAA